MKKIVIILILFVLCVNMFVISSYGFSVNDLPLSIETSTGKVYDILSYPTPSSSFDYTDIMIAANDNNFSLYFFNKDDIYYYSDTRGNFISSFSGNKSICSYQVNVSYYEQPYKSEYFYLNGCVSSVNLGKSEKSFFSSCDILGEDGTVVIKKSVNYPHFITSEEDLSSGKFDFLQISAGNLNNFDDEFGLAIFDASLGITKLRPLKSFVLNYYSNYCDNLSSDIIYYIPREDLGIDLSNGKKYMFTLSPLDGSEIYDSVNFEVGNLTTEEELKNKQDLTNSKIDEQTNAIKEQTETNKNIFEKIGDILSYINPFSENFFVYKLIELLVDAIKSLFIPSDEFFNSYFTDLKDWFSDRLGFLFYPFEIVIDILYKISNINFKEPIFNIPDIYEPTTHVKLIGGSTFNLNSLVSEGMFKMLHDIYLLCVDAFIIFELVNLFRRKYEEVTTK